MNLTKSLCLTLLLVSMATLERATPINAAELSSKVKETQEAFNEEMRSVRSEHMLLPVSYIELDGKSYGIFIPRRLVFMAEAGDLFRIRKVKTRHHYLSIELESNRKARLNLRLYDVKKKPSSMLMDEVFPKMLSDLFEFGPSPTCSRVVGNSFSGIAHLGACNHLPEMDLRKPFPDLKSAEEAGFRICPACFPPAPPLPIPNYMPVRTRALEAARIFERAFPPIEDPVLQNRIQDLGERLVDALPFPAKGFSYRFKVVESELITTQAFPTGFVYLTDKLLDAVESESELAFVLAEEIIRCEIHLAPNEQLVMPKSEMFWGDFHKETEWRWLEADLLSIGTVKALYPDEDSTSGGINILKKLQFANESLPMHEEWTPDSTYLYGDRLVALKNNFFPMVSERIFEARDDNGDWVYRVKILGGRHDTEELDSIYLLVEVAPSVRKSLKIPKRSEEEDTILQTERKKTSSFLVFPEGRPVELTSGRAVEITPGNIKTVMLQLESNKRERLDFLILKSIVLKGSQDVEWIVVPEK